MGLRMLVLQHEELRSLLENFYGFSARHQKTQNSQVMSFLCALS